MLSLQILDAGRRFLHPLEPRPIDIGSADDADIRLTEAGIAERHARIEPAADGSFTLVDLGSSGGTLVNGEPVGRVRLEVGDRIEVGGAVLMVGQRMVRQATARDVLGDPLVVTRPRIARPARRSRWPAIGLGVLVLAVIAAVVFGPIDDSRAPAALERVARLRAGGSFEEARAVLRQVRATWVDGREKRAARLDAEDQRLEAVALGVEAGVLRLRQEARELNYAELLLGLRARERDGTAVQREVAHLLRSRLWDTIDDVPRLSLAPPAGLGESPDPATDLRESIEAALASKQVDALLESVAALAAAGNYAQAMELLRGGMAGSAFADAERLRRRLDRVRGAAKEEMASLLARAEILVTAGNRSGARTLLASAAHRFPSTGDLSGMHRRIEELEREPASTGLRSTVLGHAAAPSSLPGVDLRALQSLLDRVRVAEGQGDLVAAARLSRAAAASLGAMDPSFSRRLRGQGDDLDAVAAMGEALGAALAVRGRPVDVPLGDMQEGRVLRAEHGRLVVFTPRGEERWTWLQVPVAAVAKLAETLTAEPVTWLGVGAHAYRNAQYGPAESALARAWKAAPDLRDRIQGVILRGRGDIANGHGYALVDGRFVSQRDLLAEEEAVAIKAGLARAVTADKRWREFEAELFAGDADSLDALRLALRWQRDETLKRFDELPIKKQWHKLAQLRADLDAARDHARELIYDEVRYFYPFRAPAVSGERESDYWQVQREVDERVAALRTLWEGRSPRLRVSKHVRRRLEELQRVRGALASLGNDDPRVMAGIEWALTLPAAGGSVELRTIALTPEERRTFSQWNAIEAYNTKMEPTLSVAERTQLKITNGYRRMFGHPPLALNPKVHAAARGHSEEMSTLGYFSHMSPVPGRRTPYDRLRLEGYTHGVSENIARNGSPMGAHMAWLHSSGHHRNLLNPGYTEFGVGVAGRYYTQNFGRGEEYQDHRAWVEAR